MIPLEVNRLCAGWVLWWDENEMLSRCHGVTGVWGWKSYWFAFAITAAHQRQTSHRDAGDGRGGGRGKGREGKGEASCMFGNWDGGSLRGGGGGGGEHLRGRLLGSVMRHGRPSPCPLSARQKQWLEGKEWFMTCWLRWSSDPVGSGGVGQWWQNKKLGLLCWSRFMQRRGVDARQRV